MDLVNDTYRVGNRMILSKHLHPSPCPCQEHMEMSDYYHPHQEFTQDCYPYEHSQHNYPA